MRNGAPLAPARPAARKGANTLLVDYPFVPVPTSFFDVLPSLSGAESKVLLCVVRQTAGWRAKNGERKQSDWISQSQFKAKTGLASAAISRAIDSLVRQNILSADDGAGNSLNTAADRRRYRGRVFFSVWQVFQVPDTDSANGSTEVRGTINATVLNDLQNGVRKANRTKESSPTKELSRSVLESIAAEGGRNAGKSVLCLPIIGAPVTAMPEMTAVALPQEEPEEQEKRVLEAKERCQRTLQEIKGR